jgi:hypothetical protein
VVLAGFAACFAIIVALLTGFGAEAKGTNLIAGNAPTPMTTELKEAAE